MACIQLQVTGGGSTVRLLLPTQILEWSPESSLAELQTLPTGVTIPGAYSYSDPGIVFDPYNTFTSYTIPGPAVWNLASGGSTSNSTVGSNSSAVPVAYSSGVPTVLTSTKYACSTTFSASVVPAAATSSLAGTEAVAKWSQWYVPLLSSLILC